MRNIATSSIGDVMETGTGAENGAGTGAGAGAGIDLY